MHTSAAFAVICSTADFVHGTAVFNMVLARFRGLLCLTNPITLKSLSLVDIWQRSIQCCMVFCTFDVEFYGILV